VAVALGPHLDNVRLWPSGSEAMRNGIRVFYSSTLPDFSLDKLKADQRAAMKNAPGIPYLTPLLVEIQMLEVVPSQLSSSLHLSPSLSFTYLAPVHG